MKRFKEKLLENDFGAYLYDLRCKKQYTIEELVQRLNIESLQAKNIRKWEHDLEFPDLNQMYKISEIYQIPIEELMQVKTQTLQEGVKGIHKELIRIIGYLLGFSIYGTIIISYIIIFFALVWAFCFFITASNRPMSMF